MATCECCQLDRPDVKARSAMTAYHWDGTGENPNADVVLCDPCWESYRAYWQEMWDNYYSGLL